MSADFLHTFYSHLPDEPTKDQRDLAERMQRFLFGNYERASFIVRGYAGTGKTTSVAALVKTLPAFKIKSVLLAPTGRAAKVMSSFSSKMAFTIHKKIYQSQKNSDGSIRMKLGNNRHKNTIFIVDEASMISGDRSGVGRNLLEDLIDYVFQGKNCRLVFIGDIAQLPPVGSDLSPALDPKPLKNFYHLQLKGVELKQVLRQAHESGILFNASRLREQIQHEYPKIKFYLDGFNDIHRINGEELEDVLEQCYRYKGVDESMVVCRSNKRANLFNQQIRVRIKGLDERLASGDYVMVVKNNYHWIEADSPIGFIANGDIGEVLSIGNWEERYGFTFVDVQLRLLDYPQQPPLQLKVMLDVLEVDGPSLPAELQQHLFDSVAEEYQDLSTKRERMEAIKTDPYFNALQIKFAYAVTAHKSQGGQWKNVIVDQGYLTEEMIDQQYARWLYTAISRASEQLYLLNFSEHFFSP
ncbi:MAG: ATP-dependent endonuclease [Flavobacteriales bacterium]|nr:ATP-dependent endonuclease [Flavobacteriales bacterium]|tara:strand:- start:876 stop:2282 length:1407 start_codon:yes stop_codon:yes gene_type:complete